MAKKGISINVIFMLPARKANPIISTIEIALSILPKKNVCGISKSMPVTNVKATKTGTADLPMPNVSIIFRESGLL